VYQDFLDFIDGQTGIQPMIQDRLEAFDIAIGGKRRYRDDALLPLVQCLMFFHSIHLLTNCQNGCRQ